jgi:hypothetical protein
MERGSVIVELVKPFDSHWEAKGIIKYKANRVCSGNRAFLDLAKSFSLSSPFNEPVYKTSAGH